MFRHRWTEGNSGGTNKKEDHDDSTASSAYEVVEEEVLETLSDYGDDLALAGEVEIEIEEEVLETSRLYGISEEGDGEDEDTEGEYEERSVYTEFEGMNGSGLLSLTEVEVDEADADLIYQTMIANCDLVDEEEVTVGDESSVEEVTLHEDEDDLALLESQFISNVQITEAKAASSSDGRRKPPGRAPLSNYETEEEDDDTASAEECREAIDYILRQERAVAKMILTEEQAEKMVNLPTNVMKIIVDHMELCDNNDSPIDWDFLLKIVMPFCNQGGADDDSSDEEEQGACKCG